MALNQMNKLVWIVETIRNAGFITFNELNEKWKDNDDISNGEQMLKRSFHKWRDAIWDLFGLDIECEKGGEYRYYISNLEDLKSNSIAQWLLNTYSLTNSIGKSRSIQDKILLENIPSGQLYLNPIIDAIKSRHTIHITYYNYWRGDERNHILMPLCIKLFKRRWYIVGKSCRSGFTSIYCLDRIRNFKILADTYSYPEDFKPNDYFYGYYGVIHDENTPVETIRLKVSQAQANYIRDLPICEDNQYETESNSDYSIFEIKIRPTYDFQQELLAHGEGIEVLEPQWLRKEMAQKIKKMCENYKKQIKK